MAVVVSVVMVVGLEVTLVALVMTQGDLAPDLVRVEMAVSLMEGVGTRRTGTKNTRSIQLCKNINPL